MRMWRKMVEEMGNGTEEECIDDMIQAKWVYTNIVNMFTLPERMFVGLPGKVPMVGSRFSREAADAKLSLLGCTFDTILETRLDL